MKKYQTLYSIINEQGCILERIYANTIIGAKRKAHKMYDDSVRVEEFYTDEQQKYDDDLSKIGYKMMKKGEHK